MTIPTWFPDELAHAGEEHLDPGYVPGYDDKSQTNPSADLDPLRALGLNETHTMIDLGAGTGTFALAAAPYCRKVIAVDVSPQMLGLLKQKIDRAGIDNIECVQAGFLSYQHGGEPVDFVYSRHALHHLPDFWKVIALNRIANLLKPGGVLYLRDLVYAFEPAEAEQTIEKWLEGAVDDPAKGWTREELETHVREEFSPFSWLLEPMIERSGFRIQDIQRQGQIYAAYTCVKTV
jgi:ubiquinone/menaquinone biosynthesis C-methylase UbiE